MKFETLQELSVAYIHIEFLWFKSYAKDSTATLSQPLTQIKANYYAIHRHGLDCGYGLQQDRSDPFEILVFKDPSIPLPVPNNDNVINSAFSNEQDLADQKEKSKENNLH